MFVFFYFEQEKHDSSLEVGRKVGTLRNTRLGIIILLRWVGRFTESAEALATVQQYEAEIYGRRKCVASFPEN